MKRALSSFAGLFLFICLLVPAGSALAISRGEVLVRAQTYCFHPWHCGQSNLTASCSGTYQSVYTPGDYYGLPYDWGGYVTLFEFDDGIKSGNGAGSYSDHGVLSCTVGLDCSGFVSKAWGVGHFGTSTISGTSHEIAFGEVKEADAFNVAGYHIILYGGELAGGWPLFYEAVGYNAQVNSWAGWANVSGFTPIRLDSIQDFAPGNDLGTAPNPIKVTQLPYVHNGDTSNSLSDMFDYYGADTSKKESGPEVIYEVDISSPGTLTVSVQDGAGVDIDVHLCSALETYHCEARHDTLIEFPVTKCGKWYVVADTWCNSSGVEFPGPYTLSIELQPSGGGCTQSNEPFDFKGQPGDECGYPGNPNLPFCNPNLGAITCLYSDQPGNKFSFCSFNCGLDGDCTDVFPDGCCADITGSGDPQDRFCVEESLCQPVVPPVDEGPDEPGPDVQAQPDVPVVVPDVVVAPDQVAIGPDGAVPPDVLEGTPDGGAIAREDGIVPVGGDVAGEGDRAGGRRGGGGAVVKSGIGKVEIGVGSGRWRVVERVK